jgi:hypothetical protein
MDRRISDRKNGGMGDVVSHIDVVVEPGSSRFDPDDAGWRDQVVALRRRLAEADIDGVRREEIPSPGHKAGVETLIIALGSSGAIAAAVEVVRSWLSRDRTRHIGLRYRDGDREVTLRIDGTTVSDATMAAALTAALDRLAGPPDEP